MSGSSPFQFIVKKGPNAGHIYPIFADKMTIGRDPMSDIIFKDPEVSRRHVHFIRTKDGYLIEDLGSTNGTFIDGQKLTGEQILLSPGQEIALGGAITLIFESRDNEAEVVGTVNTLLPTDNPDAPQAINDDEANLGDYTLDQLDEEDEEEEDHFHSDQLQSLSPLSKQSSPHKKISQPDWPKEAHMPLSQAGRGKTYTQQQIIYIIIVTTVATIIACGVILLLYNLIANR